MTVPQPRAVDVTSISAVVVCAERRCGWRAVALTEDSARLRYHEHWRDAHGSGRQPRAQQGQGGTGAACGRCGSTEGVKPRKRLCAACWRAYRTERERERYKRRRAERDMAVKV